MIAQHADSLCEEPVAVRQMLRRYFVSPDPDILQKGAFLHSLIVPRCDAILDGFLCDPLMIPFVFKVNVTFHHSYSHLGPAFSMLDMMLNKSGIFLEIGEFEEFDSCCAVIKKTHREGSSRASRHRGLRFWFC